MKTKGEIEAEISGAVVLRGTFEHTRDVLFLKHKVAGIEGVIAIEIQTRFNV
ncbi:MAG: hypothetical protein ACE10H_14025 [Candidatus Binatia bacterium]